jgi:hypothetical protein
LSCRRDQGRDSRDRQAVQYLRSSNARQPSPAPASRWRVHRWSTRTWNPAGWSGFFLRACPRGTPTSSCIHPVRTNSAKSRCSRSGSSSRFDSPARGRHRRSSGAGRGCSGAAAGRASKARKHIIRASRSQTLRVTDGPPA